MVRIVLLFVLSTCLIIPPANAYKAIKGASVTAVTKASLNSVKTALLGQYVINAAGYYTLTQTLDVSPAAANIACIYINASNVVLDLNSNSITLSTTTYQKNNSAIEVAPNLYNITIMNGVINGAGVYTSTPTGIKVNSGVSDLYIDNIDIIKCAVEGINLNAVNSATLSNMNIYNNGSQSYTVNTSKARGLVLTSCNDINIFDSIINKTTAPNAAPNYGIYATSCNNLYLKNLQASNTTASSGIAQAIYLNSCTNVVCENIVALNSRATGSLTKPIIVAGFNLINSSNCIFSKCIANNELSTITTSSTYGFRLAEKSNNNSFSNCNASGNLGGGTSCGFQLSSSSFNTYEKCSATSNGGPTRAAYGFQSGTSITTTCTGNTFIKCAASNNYSVLYTGYGFALFAETGSIIQNCEATLNAAKTISYGIALLSTCLKNSVEYCTMRTNIGLTGAYGFKDCACNSTTLLRGNVSFGQGQTLNSVGTKLLPDSRFMNYYFEYLSPAMHEYNSLVEYTISTMNKLNAIAPTYSNVSIIQSPLI